MTGTVARLYTSDEVAAMVDQLTAERDAAFFELMDRRTEVRELAQRVRELVAAAADHPSDVARLTAECQDWAARCGAAEVDRDQAAEAGRRIAALVEQAIDEQGEDAVLFAASVACALDGEATR
jgi:cell division septum initiation protein DivIVA